MSSKSNGHISATIYPIHRPYFVLGHVMTVDEYDRRFDTYIAKDGNWQTYDIKRKHETADLEKYTRK